MGSRRAIWRRNSSGAFTASSGVFVSTDGGNTWQDRSAAGMQYYTRDIVIDPFDNNQNTWYAGVWSGWGGPPNGLGGLYRSTNRGQSWTRINALDRVSSVTRPVKELKGFQRISLAPGEKQTVTLDISPRSLAFWNIDMQFVVEPGEFDLMVGPNSVDVQTIALTVAKS